MILYPVIIVCAFNLIAFLNGYFSDLGLGTSYVYSAIALVCAVATDAVIALLVRRIPEEKINPFSPIFLCGNREKKFYKAIHVRSWKDYIPETGKYLCHFAKDEIADPTNNTYIIRFLRETCYASIMHIISIFAGFIVMIFLPITMTITLPVMLVNAVLQFLPVCVQRYNRPRLIMLYKRNEKLYGDKSDKEICPNAVSNG